MKLWFISREPLNVGTIGHRGAKMTASDWSRADNWVVSSAKAICKNLAGFISNVSHTIECDKYAAEGTFMNPNLARG